MPLLGFCIVHTTVDKCVVLHNSSKATRTELKVCESLFIINHLALIAQRLYSVARGERSRGFIRLLFIIHVWFNYVLENHKGAPTCYLDNLQSTQFTVDIKHRVSLCLHRFKVVQIGTGWRKSRKPRDNTVVTQQLYTFNFLLNAIKVNHFLKMKHCGFSEIRQ